MNTRVAHLIETLDTGGAESVLAGLVNNYSACFAPIVICLKHSGETAGKITRPGVEVLELNKKEGNDYRVPLTIASILRERGVGILHTHNWNVFCEGMLAAMIARVPVRVHTVHGHFTQYPPDFVSRLKNNIRHGAESLFSNAADAIVCVSEEVMASVSSTLAIAPHKMILIKNGIPIPPEPAVQATAASNDEVLIISVGRLAQVKNYPVLIEAVSLLDRPPAFRLLIAGSGPEQGRLEKMVERMGLSERVRLLGQRSDIRELLCSAHVFALASDYEGTSMAILEAMSMGLPVVATNVGGNPGVVLDGVTGYLVEPGNPRSMAGALGALLKDPAMRSQMGRSGYKRAAGEFSVGRSVREYERLYSSLMKARSNARPQEGRSAGNV